jgi:hypothetical protein
VRFLRFAILNFVMVALGLAAGPHLSLSISAPMDVYRVGDAITVRATLATASDSTNAVGEIFLIDFGRVDRDYSVDIKDAAGNRPQESEFAKRLKHSVTDVPPVI